ncbi:methyltransferase, FxLD system [Streptomyces sp. NPDC003077]|uniref:methyltransferase, FxLD system n=1 Tax=Streptomyces sp. NPDC003077 TaxID=3154443 RepID=UPI0033BB8840
MPPAPDWHQITCEFTDPHTADQTAAHHLAPALNTAEDPGVRRTWWFLRKAPGWRLRFQPDAPHTSAVTELLARLTADGHLASWTRGIYEPEALAFGGAAAMDAAHTLFHHDSQCILNRTDLRLGRRESTVLLFSAMLRAAGLDWFEQGDVWAKITALRPAPQARSLAPEPSLGRAVRHLMTAEPRSVPDLLPDPWLTAYETAGRALASLARRGQLERGLRAICAHHFLFHANRAGLTGAEQATLAALAVHAVFHSPDQPISPCATSGTSMVRDMTTTLSDTPSSSADALRNELADHLRETNTVRSATVDAAFRSVPRHAFVPGVPLKEAYADDAVYTKRDANGARISAASQPKIVAMMLEQLRLEPGHGVLELGAGTGYNAALMAAIVGEAGCVTTIDVDADLVDGARKHLAAAGFSTVEVILADGALGHPDAAPYDRIIATVGAYEIPTPWLDQLAPHGLLVVPLRLAGAASRSIAFHRGEAGWTSRESEMAVFMPLRGIGDDARRVIDLTGDGTVTLQTHKDNAGATDPDALDGVLESPRNTVWTDVLFAPMESFEWLDLWLACRLPNPIMRMDVQPTAKDSGLVSPMFPVAAMSTTAADGSLAYLTIRPAEPAADGGKRYEVGVIGHGPTGAALAEHVGQEINTWHEGFRNRTVRFAIPTTPDTPAPDAGRFVLHRPHHPITVAWE